MKNEECRALFDESSSTVTVADQIQLKVFRHPRSGSQINQFSAGLEFMAIPEF